MTLVPPRECFSLSNCTSKQANGSSLKRRMRLAQWARNIAKKWKWLPLKSVNNFWGQQRAESSTWQSQEQCCNFRADWSARTHRRQGRCCFFHVCSSASFKLGPTNYATAPWFAFRNKLGCAPLYTQLSVGKRHFRKQKGPNLITHGAFRKMASVAKSICSGFVFNCVWSGRRSIHFVARIKEVHAFSYQKSQEVAFIFVGIFPHKAPSGK